MVCRSILISNLKNRVAQKLHNIILLQFGRLIVRFHFPTTMKLLIFMVLGISGNVYGPQEPLFWSSGPLNYSKQGKNQSQIISKEYSAWKYGNLNVVFFFVSYFWKGRVSKHHDDPSNNILKILDMRSILRKKHEMDIWY